MLLPLCAVVSSPQEVQQERGVPVETEEPQHRFLKLGEGERYWFYEGAFRTLATWVATIDEEKGDCIASWYLQDRENKQRLIERALAEDPTENESVVILSLLIYYCGDITFPERVNE